jgi:hypothetical protein
MRGDVLALRKMMDLGTLTPHDRFLEWEWEKRVYQQDTESLMAVSCMLVSHSARLNGTGLGASFNNPYSVLPHFPLRDPTGVVSTRA